MENVSIPELDLIAGIANELELPKTKIKATSDLLQDGNTVPFIARYRKEATGNLDEVQIRDIQASSKRLEDLQARKLTVQKALIDQSVWNSALAERLIAADSLQKVEDFYLPYKQKRRTKATIAKEAGLMPLAQKIQSFPTDDLNQIALDYVDPAQDLPDVKAVMNGVHEIFAEVIGENAGLREWIRNYTQQNGTVDAKIKRGAQEQDPKSIYALYYDFSQKIKQIQNHQILAVNRGEKAGILSVGIEVDQLAIERYLKFRLVGSKQGAAAEVLVNAAKDAYKRFIGPAIEREIRKQLTAQASADAIKVFGKNLYHLLMGAPLRGQVVLGFDPGIRTGSKLAVVDENGKFLEKAVIYPHRAAKYDPAGAKKIIINLVHKYQVTLVAIGNGTASRESQQFIADLIKSDLPDLKYVVVNEAGASVYSASDIARTEFPELQVEQRSAISIARRLQDPMAELIKIDPQAVGVGQYQHDLPTKELSEQLDQVLETAVNQVGVNLNTASAQLLLHIAGLTKTTAQNIVDYRDHNGAFKTRNELKKVAKLGPKAFEQAAGFLRIPNGTNSLDNTEIHPESYKVAKELLKRIDATDVESRQQQLQALATDDVAKELQIGLPTLYDIIDALKHPGRDLRDQAISAVLRSDVLTLKDLKPGMELQGTVRNVVDFGAFVDIGVHEDGLVHINEMVKNKNQHHKLNPHDHVAVGDIITVWVKEVDLKRERIGLTLFSENIS
ncbi:Tex family protein [Weissella koreensis]|uniref:Tex family protein n=1 Tax=Weissella koreensis TaxID=165096 RepID=UPI0002174CF0|nr:Tex family protein [Weissella koreensis]AEJ23868.1 transcriptional accessory protein [Weissella koreensis KACC 15510]AVH75493.1 RNA-binding transcriptional accessory protein [Weissella koreensis]EJF34472.1 S1 domain RNA-binding protein [Weissella koreensis KCTC 3621]QGN20716.1 S1 RNA-binding domain-containing protein [Weissella koreensis]